MINRIQPCLTGMLILAHSDISDYIIVPIKLFLLHYRYTA